jgi:uncharacterized protein YndB with AHSA1/START domain
MTLRDRITHEVIYPQPIEQVWAALTEADQLAAWLMDNDFVLCEGQAFTFFEHEPWPDGQFIDVKCRVVACDPPHRLAYTWASPPKLGETLVEWELEPLPQGTRVRLTHSGFARHGEAGREAFDILENGWGGLLREELAEFLRSGTPAERPAVTRA